MAGTSFRSQSTTSSSTSYPGVMASRDSAAATARMCHHCVTISSNSSSSSGSVGGSGGGSNLLQFYTDDAPSLKISPTVALVMSLYFIGFIIALHVFGKFYHYKLAA